MWKLTGFLDIPCTAGFIPFYCTAVHIIAQHRALVVPCDSSHGFSCAGDVSWIDAVHVDQVIRTQCSRLMQRFQAANNVLMKWPMAQYHVSKGLQTQSRWLNQENNSRLAVSHVHTFIHCITISISSNCIELLPCITSHSIAWHCITQRACAHFL